MFLLLGPTEELLGETFLPFSYALRVKKCLMVRDGRESEKMREREREERLMCSVRMNLESGDHVVVCECEGIREEM